MTSYRYINRDQTLVLRDDTVIAWDARADAPATEQHGTDDEQKLWKDAGSPHPMEMALVATPTSSSPYAPSWTLNEPMPSSEQQSFADPVSELDKIDNALQSRGGDDIAGLKQQVQALTRIVRIMVGGRRKTDATS